MGKQHLCFSATGIFAGQEADVVKYHWLFLMIRTGELVLGILDGEVREWWVEKGGQRVISPFPSSNYYR